MDLKNIKTFVFIDVSNIRSACVRNCNFNISFMRLSNYLKHKYHNLQDVRYYEGLAIGDLSKENHLKYLRERGNYTICTLERKSYFVPAQKVKCVCDFCGRETEMLLTPATTRIKSNVDVYIAANMIETAVTQDGSLHFILMSCDGDYDEAIRTIFRLNSNVYITILATPLSKTDNSLSLRLKNLQSEFHEQITITSIADLRDRIAYTRE